MPLSVSLVSTRTMRARKICSHPHCFELQPCPDHARKPWEGSKRNELATVKGATGTKRRRRVLLRDDFRCHMCGELRLETDLVADHVVPLAEGGADRDSNVKALCLDCDRVKTAAEAARGRRRAR